MNPRWLLVPLIIAALWLLFRPAADGPCGPEPCPVPAPKPEPVKPRPKPRP